MREAKGAEDKPPQLPPYRLSVAGTLLAAREAVMAPIRPHLREAGLTEQQWRILRVLNGEGASEPSRLAIAALLYPPSVTRILKELLERGLIERAADPNDGRRAIVAISKKGAKLVHQTSAHTLQVLRVFSERFGAERLSALLDEIREFTSAIDLGEDSDAMLAEQRNSEEG